MRAVRVCYIMAVIILISMNSYSAENLTESEKKRKELNEKFDKLKLREKTVLCWIEEYYFEKYGYWVGGTYGIEITEDGSSLVICMNGSFQGRDKPFGKPSLFVVNIPLDERPQD